MVVVVKVDVGHTKHTTQTILKPVCGLGHKSSLIKIKFSVNKQVVSEVTCELFLY